MANMVNYTLVGSEGPLFLIEYEVDLRHLRRNRSAWENELQNKKEKKQNPTKSYQITSLFCIHMFLKVYEKVIV